MLFELKLLCVLIFMNQDITSIFITSLFYIPIMRTRNRTVILIGPTCKASRNLILPQYSLLHYFIYLIMRARNRTVILIGPTCKASRHLILPQYSLLHYFTYLIMKARNRTVILIGPMCKASRHLIEFLRTGYLSRLFNSKHSPYTHTGQQQHQ